MQRDVTLLLECRADATVESWDRLEETAVDVARRRTDATILEAFHKHRRRKRQRSDRSYSELGNIYNLSYKLFNLS